MRAKGPKVRYELPGWVSPGPERGVRGVPRDCKITLRSGRGATGVLQMGKVCGARVSLGVSLGVSLKTPLSGGLDVRHHCTHQSSLVRDRESWLGMHTVPFCCSSRPRNTCSAQSVLPPDGICRSLCTARPFALLLLHVAPLIFAEGDFAFLFPSPSFVASS